MPPAPRRAAAALPPSPRLPAWGAWCFFTSGAAALLYEVVWSKQLSYLLGNSLHATATVVAAFLAGLALGARLLGARLARRGRGPRTYAVLEWSVGALGVLVLVVLRSLDPLVGAMYRSFGGETAPFAIARFGLLAALLVPPAAMMGATLPVLVEHFERARVGPALALLYALNTLGAVAGSLVAGFVLMPGLGLLGTSLVAAALNLAVGALAWRAGAPGPVAVSEPPRVVATAPKKIAPADEPLAGAQRAAFVAMFGLSGCAALMFQIAWVRLFSLVFGSSVYSFSAVLGVYLLGLGAGSLLIGPRVARPGAMARFARLQLVLAAGAALMLPAFSRLPQWMYDLAAGAGGNWSALLLGETGITALLLFVPCACLGAAFPLATRLLQVRDGGHAAGFAYAVNTVGTIAGTLLAGFVLVPWLGVQGTHVAALAVSLSVGLASLALARARGEFGRADLAWAAAALAVALPATWMAPRWNASIMSSGAFRPVQASHLAQAAELDRGPATVLERASRLERVLYYREGINGSVLVGSDSSRTNRWLRVSGKIDASTSDMETQVLLGLVPAALADSGARAMVIGLGSGVTAAGVLAGGAGPTDVVELEPGVVEASRFFFEHGGHPLDDPRAHLVIGDARTHLEHGGGRYGLIVSEPSNPWIAGVNNLFTVDFYRRVRSRLAPDGVFCQWMQLYELSPQTFSTMLASFFEVFPEGHVMCVWKAVDLLLVAAPDSRSLSLSRLASPAARALLARTSIGSPEAVAGYYAGPFAALDSTARGAALNRDDRPIVEYRAPRDMAVIGQRMLHGDPAVVDRVPFATSRPAGEWFAPWPADRWAEARTEELIAQGESERASRMVSALRGEGRTALADRLGAEAAWGARRQTAQRQVDDALRLLAMGRGDEARRSLENAVANDSTHARAWLMLADQRQLAGDLPGAIAAARHVGGWAKPWEQGLSQLIQGIVYYRQQQFARSIESLRSSQSLDPRAVRAYLYEAQAHLDSNDEAAARDALTRGLAALPGNAELTSALAQLSAARLDGRVNP